MGYSSVNANIKAAGGVVTTWDNRDAVNAGSILVSANQSIHNKMLKLLKPVSKINKWF